MTELLIKKSSGEPSLAACREACKTCTVGSCCYEGVELTREEVKKIIAFNPDVPKPWFRLVEKGEGLQRSRPFTTVLRNGTCVFQDKYNRCRIYKVRPQPCRDFPYEGRQAAPYYKELCVLFKDQWSRHSDVFKTYNQREKRRNFFKKL